MQTVKLYQILLFCICVVMNYGCQTKDEISHDEIVITNLIKEYGLKQVCRNCIELDSLPVSSVDNLDEFIKSFVNLKGKRLPLKVEPQEGEKFLLKMDYEDYLEEVPLKSRTTETVHINEFLTSSLGLIQMNVWLDITIPKVIDSSITGVTLFDRWEQKSADAHKDGEYIYFTIHGIWYWKLIIDGITDIYSYSASFGGSYNRLTKVGDLYIF